MDVQAAVELLRGRVTWPEMRSILKNLELPTALGWEKTLDKLKEQLTTAVEKNQASAGLFQAYKDTLRFGTKAIRLFRLDPAEMGVFFKNVGRLTAVKSSYSSTYPLPLSVADLYQQSVQPTLVDINLTLAQCDLVYCSKRHFSVREEIDVAKLGQAQQQAFGVFDTLIGLRNEIRQGFDVITFHREAGLVELRVDLLQGVSWEDSILFLKHLESALYRMLCEFIGTKKFTWESVNFFPLLQKLYDDADGRVVEIGHDTGGTGGIIREKMRRKTLDVREEEFHVAGVSATEIELFEIAKVWGVPLAEGVFEVHVPGSVRLISEVSPVISEVVVKGCISPAHYREAFSKITSHL